MKAFKGATTETTNIYSDRPSVNSTVMDRLPSGTEVQIRNSIKGQKINRNDRWYVLSDESMVWSGSISTSASAIPHIPKQVLVTADDIGIVEDIDKAAMELLENGSINSIAVFMNQQNAKQRKTLDYVKNFLNTRNRVGENRPLKETTHIGLHFTITSGKPIIYPSEPADKFKLLTTKSGNFRQFKSIGDNYEKDSYFNLVTDQFEKQIKKFKNQFGQEPDHITSHHDTLTFNKRYFHFLMDYALGKNIPMRSQIYLPRYRRVFYDIPIKADIPSSKKMTRWRRSYERQGKIVPGPEKNYAGHYGPLPDKEVGSYKDCVKNKQEKLRNWIDRLYTGGDEIREIMVHLIKSDLRRQSEFEKEYAYVKQEYSGVDIRYFDGRRAEYMSMQSATPWKTDEWLDFAPKGYWQNPIV